MISYHMQNPDNLGLKKHEKVVDLPDTHEFLGDGGS